MGLRNNGIQEYIEREKVFMTKNSCIYELIDPFCLNIAGRVLPTVSPEGGPQQMGEIKEYL